MSDRSTAPQAWVRRRGLPQVLPASVRVRGLLGRCAPLLASAVVLDIGWRVLTHVADAVADAEELGNESRLSFLYLVVSVTVLAVPIVTALAAWAVSRLTRGGGAAAQGVGAACVVLLIVAAPAMGGVFRTHAWGPAVVGRLVVALLVLWVAYLGVGTLLRWGMRRTVAELASVGPMVLRVLPVLMLAVLFLFFNAEIWQVAFGISTARAVAVGLVLGTLAVLVVVVTALDEIRPVLDRDDAEDAARDPALLDGTPFAGTVLGHRAHPFRFGERINFLVIPIAAQSIQVMIFGSLMLVFFLLFGSLSITEAVAKAWIGQPPPRMEIVGLQLPVSVPLARVSFILSNFCALSFAASASSDAAYRSAFLEPILHETRVNLAARHAYQHLQGESADVPEGDAPPGDQRSGQDDGVDSSRRGGDRPGDVG